MLKSHSLHHQLLEYLPTAPGLPKSSAQFCAAQEMMSAPSPGCLPSSFLDGLTKASVLYLVLVCIFQMFFQQHLKKKSWGKKCPLRKSSILIWNPDRVHTNDQ